MTGRVDACKLAAHWHDVEPFLPEALALSIIHEHPVYDFCYVVPARSLQLSVVTADDTLIRKIRGTNLANSLRALSDLT